MSYLSKGDGRFALKDKNKVDVDVRPRKFRDVFEKYKRNHGIGD